MNIYKHELRFNFRTTLSWTIAFCGIFTFYMAFYSAFTDSWDEFMKIFEQMSANLGGFFDLSLVGLDRELGIIQYYSIMFNMVTLIAQIQAANLGISMVSKEIRMKTADFLLTKPASRIKIMNSKILASVTILIFTNICFLVLNVIFIMVYKGEYLKFIMISLTVFFMQLIFFSVGLFISVCVRKLKNTLPVAFGVVFLFFALHMMVDDKKLRFVNPFEYFNLAYIINNGSYDLMYILLGFAVFAFFIAASYLVYSLKDIHAV